jgi:hypothetical protein
VDDSGPQRGRGIAALCCLVGYRACYLVMLASGKAAAHLAADFRALGAASARLGPLRPLLQLPVLACWLLVRPISLAAFAGCCELAPRMGRRR